jgi:hypothetical protein
MISNSSQGQESQSPIHVAQGLDMDTTRTDGGDTLWLLDALVYPNGRCAHGTLFLIRIQWPV